jgi:hypothetical protein
MLRAASLSIVLAICVSGLPPVWQSKQLPPCCKLQHGCTMAKRAAAQCAFATCDQEGVVTALKMPRAIAPATVIAAVPRMETPLETLAVALRLPLGGTDIDHPPRLLLA